MNSQPKLKLSVPVAIVIGAVVVGIGLAIGLSVGGGGGDFSAQLERYQEEQQLFQIEAQQQQEQKLNELVENVALISDSDHVRGDKNAPVTIIEYSDFECPFCKRFHETMNQVIDEYGDSGKVAWVYRHFPLESLHPVKARREAVATECAAELGGERAFWDYADRFFEITPSNNRTDIDAVLPQIAGELGLDVGAFNECLDSGRHNEKIDADLANAQQTGGRGTPWSILIKQDGEKFPVNGALPYEMLKDMIEQS